MEASRRDIERWLFDVLKKDNFQKIHIEYVDSFEKGDGYVGDIKFVKVTGLNSDGRIENTFDLVLKCGKNDEILRQKIPLRNVFLREIFVYTTVLDIYRGLEAVHNVNILNDLLPKCYGTLLYDQQEVIILHNLKSLDYHLFDRFKPLDLAHLKLTMKGYGKWHALSLAYREKYPDDFARIFASLESSNNFFGNLRRHCFEQSQTFLFEELENSGQLELLQRLQERLPENVPQFVMDLFASNDDICVFRHGDCWNNNFMFRYHDKARTSPKSVTFLDFQTSDVGSPITDLSYHIYATSSAKELVHFKELLQIYHVSLAETLRLLGCDCNEIFPYQSLVSQWKKYSLFGLVKMAAVLPLTLASKEDTTDINELVSEQSAKIFEVAKKKGGNLIRPRVIAAVKHYLEFNDF